MATLTLENLTKRYSGVVSVDAISLDIEHGEFVCLLGPSGCGKTTTLRMIAGFLDPDGGAIRVNGAIVSSPGAVVPPERRNMSMIFQSYAIWPHMTVRQNVGYALKMKRMAAAEMQSRIDVLLAATQLTAQAERYPSELSGGQQQRVALARALAPKPDILLLDEPLSNLDANLRGSMRFEIRRLHDEFQYTSIYVTHDQVEAMTMADRIVVMNAGRIEQIGTPEEVYERPHSEFVARFIGGSNVLKVTHAGGRRVDARRPCARDRPGRVRRRRQADEHLRQDARSRTAGGRDSRGTTRSRASSAARPTSAAIATISSTSDRRS